MHDGEPQDPNAGQPYPPYYQQPWTYPSEQSAQSTPYPPYSPGQPTYPPANPTYRGYPPPPYSGYQLRPARPGTVTAAAVLSFVTAGLLIFAAMVLLTSVSAVNDFDTTDRFRSTTAEFGLDGLLNLAAAALLVTGGVKLLAHKRAGQLLIWIGAGLTVCYALYWMMRVDAIFGVMFWATLFGSLAIVAACMVGSATSRHWLDTEPATTTPTAPPNRPY